jgi:outer membrane receptor for ferrienterochelin and colicins
MPNRLIPPLLLAGLTLAAPSWADEVDTEEEEETPALDELDEPGEICVVTGSRTEQAISDTVVVTEVVTRDQIEAAGAEDASQVLDAMTGVEIVRTFRGAGVRMQGLDSEYVLVLIDGQRVIGRRDGVLDLSRIPAERIERIEVVKGAASALYGSDAIAGVINIITRQPQDPFSAEGHLSYGSRNTLAGSTVLGVKRERWSVGADLGWHSTDGYDWDPSDAGTDGNRVRQGTADIGADGKINEDWRISADASYLQRDSSGVDQTGPATFDRRNLVEEAGARLGSENFLGSCSRLRTNLSGSLLRDQYLLDQQGSDALDSYEESQEMLVQLDSQLDRVLGEWQFLSVGVEGSTELMDSPRLSRPGERYRFAAFAQDEFRLLADDQLAIVPSARVDMDSWFGVHPTPRLALRYDPWPSLALRLAGGQGFRAPVFKEMFLYFENPSASYQVEGNPDLKPETSFNLSAGVEWAPVDAIQLRVDLFRNQLEDMIAYGLIEDATSTSYARWSYVNVADALTQGVELAGSVQISEGARFDLGYTFTHTWDGENERPLDGRAPHRGNAGLTLAQADWGLSGSLRAQLVGNTRFYFDADGDGDEDQVDTDPYAVLDARIQQRMWRRRLALFAGVDNALNSGDAIYIHLDPRLFYGGFTVYHPPWGD